MCKGNKDWKDLSSWFLKTLPLSQCHHTSTFHYLRMTYLGSRPSRCQKMSESLSCVHSSCWQLGVAVERSVAKTRRALRLAWLQQSVLDKRAAAHLPHRAAGAEEVLQSAPLCSAVPPQHLQCAQCHSTRPRFSGHFAPRDAHESSAAAWEEWTRSKDNTGCRIFFFVCFSCCCCCYCRGPGSRPLSFPLCASEARGLASIVFMLWNCRAWIHHGHARVQGTVPRWHGSVQQHQFPRAHQTTSVHLQGGHCSDQSDRGGPPAAQSTTQGWHSSILHWFNHPL